MKNHKVLLVVLDGFGIRREKNGNAILHSSMPYYQSLLQNYPSTSLKAASSAVGLPPNTMGNSEVGHMTLGAGRVIPQDCVKINHSILQKSFFENPTIKDIFSHARKRGRNLHILGLLSDAKVHADINHLLALIKAARSHKVKTYLHLFTDGRDMDPHSCIPLLKRVITALHRSNHVFIATISGRYYGMDRDKRWKRTEKAYNAIISGKGRKAATPLQAITTAYQHKESDEFILPTVIDGYSGLTNNDFVFSFNFRPDRVRQLCYAFEQKGFVKFKCSSKKVSLATMTLYDQKGIVCPVVVKDKSIASNLGEVLSRNHKKQLRAAETEKYAHVTYFFNGGQEKPLPGEERIFVPSPKVSTYDKRPAMSAGKITSKVISKLGKYDFILVNYANPDMVGHTGNFAAIKKSLYVVDECLRKLISTAREKKYAVAVTGDHGNCEQMLGKWITTHTCNDVPFILVSDDKVKLVKGSLADVAPTLLEIMKIPIPKMMTGKVLFQKV